MRSEYTKKQIAETTATIASAEVEVEKLHASIQVATDAVVCEALNVAIEKKTEAIANLKSGLAKEEQQLLNELAQEEKEAAEAVDYARFKDRVMDSVMSDIQATGFPVVNKDGVLNMVLNRGGRDPEGTAYCTLEVRKHFTTSGSSRWSRRSEQDGYDLHVSFSYSCKEKDRNYKVDEKTCTVKTKKLIEVLGQVRGRFEYDVKAEENKAKKHQTDVEQVQAMLPDGFAATPEVIEKSSYCYSHRGRPEYRSSRTNEVLVSKGDKKLAHVTPNDKGGWHVTMLLNGDGLEPTKAVQLLELLAS